MTNKFLMIPRKLNNCVHLNYQEWNSTGRLLLKLRIEENYSSVETFIFLYFKLQSKVLCFTNTKVSLQVIHYCDCQVLLCYLIPGIFLFYTISVPFHEISTKNRFHQLILLTWFYCINMQYPPFAYSPYLFLTVLFFIHSGKKV